MQINLGQQTFTAELPIGSSLEQYSLFDQKVRATIDLAISERQLRILTFEPLEVSFIREFPCQEARLLGKPVCWLDFPALVPDDLAVFLEETEFKLGFTRLLIRPKGEELDGQSAGAFSPTLQESFVRWSQIYKEGDGRLFNWQVQSAFSATSISQIRSIWHGVPLSNSNSK